MAIFIFNAFRNIYYNMYLISSSCIVYFVIMYTIHIIKTLHIINILNFASKIMITSLFVNIVKNKLIYLTHIYFIDPIFYVPVLLIITSIIFHFIFSFGLPAGYRLLYAVL